MRMRILPLILILFLSALVGCQSPSPTSPVVSGNTASPEVARDVATVDAPERRADDEERSPNQPAASSRTRAVFDGQALPVGAARDGKGLVRPGKAAPENRRPAGAEEREAAHEDTMEIDPDARRDSEFVDDYYASLEERVRVRLASQQIGGVTTEQARLDSELQTFKRHDSPEDIPRENADLPPPRRRPPNAGEHPFLKKINGRPIWIPDWARRSSDPCLR